MSLYDVAKEFHDAKAERDALQQQLAALREKVRALSEELEIVDMHCQDNNELAIFVAEDFKQRLAALLTEQP
jgi:hypothetical protein